MTGFWVSARERGAAPAATLTFMRDVWDEIDDGDVSPICAACGVSALPPEAPGEPSMCENPNCPAFGELMER